ncbi:MAG TPA: hypothetical protein EYP85_01830 [Armatimonadetes bacterium]|nr:hypothetical protein [Armatimonadota bacterium]
MGKLRLIFLLLTSAGTVVVLRPLFSAPQPQHGYAGTEVCFVCHIDFARRWGQVSHSKVLLDKKRPADQRGCEACHGPGARHVAGERKVIVAWERLKLREQMAICLKCHQESVKAEWWQATSHAKMELTCTACHEVHRPVKQEHLLLRSPRETCSQCHERMAEQIKAGTHHPLAEGLLECNSCHNVHGTPYPRALNQQQEALCAVCHDRVPQPESHQRSDWRRAHRPKARAERDKCLMCHSQEGFCNRCHIVPLPHPQKFVTEHGPAARAHRQACLNCHEKKYCLLCHEAVPGGRD